MTDLPIPASVPDPYLQGRFYEGITARRILAYAVDACILLLAAGLIWLATGLLAVMTLGLLAPLQALALAALPIAYHSLLLSSPGAATLGQRLMGVRVISLAGGGPTLPQALVNSISFYASIAFTGSLILLVALFNPRRRTVHDWLAGTVVVRDRV